MNGIRGRNFTLTWAFVLLTICAGSSRAFGQFRMVVAKDGSGNYPTVQAAFDAIPLHNTHRVEVFIKNGLYREKLHLDSTYIHCYIDRHIRPEGWSAWNNTDSYKMTRFAEYKDYGPGAGLSARLSWSRQLTDEQAKQYTFKNIFGDWSPVLRQNE